MVFLGTTIGNYRNRAERGKFLSKISAALSVGDALLIGLDLVKPARDIAAGYADSKTTRPSFHQDHEPAARSELRRGQLPSLERRVLLHGGLAGGSGGDKGVY